MRVVCRITRPVYALQILIAPSSKSEQTLPETAAGLLRAALTNGNGTGTGHRAISHGDAQWYRHRPVAPALDKSPATDTVAVVGIGLPGYRHETMLMNRKSRYPTITAAVGAEPIRCASKSFGWLRRRAARVRISSLLLNWKGDPELRLLDCSNCRVRGRCDAGH